MENKVNRWKHRYNEKAELSYTIPSFLYIEPTILAEEREAIFFKNWFYVGHVEKVAVPGDYFTVELFDQNLFVMKGKDHVIRAFYNVCPHRGHELVQREGKKSIIVCPYHAWTFKTDGQFNHGRAVNQMKNFDFNEACLREVRVEQLANLLFLNLDPNAKPLNAMMPGLEEDISKLVPDLNKLTFAHRTEYKIKANWKNVVDNYLECHHCAVAHPEFVEIVDMSSYNITNFPYHTFQSGKGKKRLGCEIEADTEDSSIPTYASYWLWPNLMIDVMPGEPGLIVMSVWPISPEFTIEYLDFYYLSKEPSEEGWANIVYQDKVLTPEDIALVESVQRGLHSKGYVDGRYVIDKKGSFISEHAVHHFHGLVLKALGAI
ncbi:aromatic ring-hydroxylating oxygenase subunit alpha [Neobacillus sp. LXY-1]|uniref:aromatic ring-hydroxylating oxygenase subunit alpha n=1 Tax=Neobacillus sp. LXY-1 TaxID=3379133 RepID=UPI003EE0FE15